MAISVDWGTRVIFVPKDYMSVVQLTPTEIRTLDTFAFHADLRDLEDDAEGMPFLDTHNFVGPITVGGVSLARVIEIINGYTVTFEENPPAGSPPCPSPYAVNLSGSNNNIGDVTNVNSVSIRSANSAGLTFSKQIEDQSFEDARVWVDTVRGTSGTQFPRGTPGNPVDNPQNALSIITTRNLPNRVHLFGEINIAVDIGDSINTLGESALTSIVNFGVVGSPVTRVDVSGNYMKRCTVRGYILGNVTYEDCTLDNLNGFAGTASGCLLKGTLTLDSNNTDFVFKDCGTDGGTSTFIDTNNIIALDLTVRGFHGNITITNLTDPTSVVTVDLSSGHLELDSTCTAGTVVVRGTGQFTDNSSGVMINDIGLVEGNAGARAFGGM